MLGILELFFEKDLIKYTKLYDENNTLTVLHRGEKIIDNDLKSTVDEIINDTNSINSRIIVKLDDYIEFKFKVPAFLSKKDEKNAIDIQIKLFCNKNNYNFKDYKYKYFYDFANNEPGKKSIQVYMVNKEYLNYIINVLENRNLENIKIISKDGKEINFNDDEMTFGELLKSDISKENFAKFSASFKNKTSKSFSTRMSSFEKLIIRIIICLIIFIFCYTVVSGYISKKLCSEIDKLKVILNDSEEEIEKINNDITEILEITKVYNNALNKSEKNEITNFLEMLAESKGINVEIVSIENTENNHVKIVVKSEKYEQLGEFKKSIDEKKLLLNSKIENINKVNSLIEVIIEGDLP